MIPHLLDNPAWSALCSVQAAFAVGTDTAKRYAPALLPFAALGPGGRAADLDALIDAGEPVYLIGELPALPSGWRLELELPCAQLMAPEDVRAEGNDRLVPLGEEHGEELYRLIMAVQPGYYLPDTRRLGNYYGIFDNGRLAAVAGERMRMTGYSEISAVCTLPEYRGRGYAQQLMGRVCEAQTAAGVQPFLHVARANETALRLYARLGFRQRRDITFWRIRKISD